MSEHFCPDGLVFDENIDVSWAQMSSWSSLLIIVGTAPVFIILILILILIPIFLIIVVLGSSQLWIPFCHRLQRQEWVATTSAIPGHYQYTIYLILVIFCVHQLFRGLTILHRQFDTQIILQQSSRNQHSRVCSSYGMAYLVLGWSLWYRDVVIDVLSYGIGLHQWGGLKLACTTWHSDNCL